MPTVEEEHELLTRTGPGTPCGELMRRYWQPVAFAEELPVGGSPLPIRLLGEDLVLFRDDHGRPGLLGIHCSHRGADLSYGRLEDGGLRCIYHGWLYDVHGRCLEQPGDLHHPFQAYVVPAADLDRWIQHFSAWGIPCQLTGAEANDPDAEGPGAALHFRDPDGNNLALVSTDYPQGGSFGERPLDGFSLSYRPDTWPPPA